MVPSFVIAPLVAGITTSALGIAVATIVVNLAIAAVLGKVLAPDINTGAERTKGLQNVIRDNVMPRRIIYGEAIVGGPYAVLETIGLNNETLSMVVILATHPVEDILGVYIDDEYVDVSGINNSANDLDTLYWVDQGTYGTGDAVEHVKIIKNNGWGYADYKYVSNGSNSDAVADRSRGASISSYLNTVWTQPATTARDSETGLYTDEGYKLTNCAHIFLSFKFNPDVWSGFPQLRFHVKGKRLYNPARDSSLTAEGAAESPLNHSLTDPDTWEWSDNWALCCLDYILNTFYGLGAKTTGLLTEIDWAEFIQAYYDSSEQVPGGYPSPDIRTVDRYTVNGIIETSSTPISVMESLLTSGSGQLIYAQGEYKLRAGVYKPPTSDNDVINEDYMVSGLSIQTHPPRSTVFNKASGIFVDIGYDRDVAISDTNKPKFEPTDFELVDPLDSGGINPYEIEDEEEIIKEFDYPFTIHEFEAKRLARIQLERVRKGLTISFEGNLKMLKYSVGDNVYLEIFNNPKYSNEAFFNRLGLDDQVQAQDSPRTSPYYKQFKIIDMQYTENFTINVVMIEEDEQIYDWNDGDANLIDHALISEIVFDDPTGEIIKPYFGVSPAETIDEVFSWPNLSTYVRWTAPSRGSQLNALDRAQIRSYALEYGEVTNPSAVETEDRVTNWINTGSFIVSDPSLDIQGPISLENLFIDDVTVFDFRIRAILYSGRKSNWAYYSEDTGGDFLPSAPPSAAVSTPIAGQRTLYYDTQRISSVFTGGGLAPGEFALYSNLGGISWNPAKEDVTKIYFNTKDADELEPLRFYNALRAGDAVTLYISAKRWFKYKAEPYSSTDGVMNIINNYSPYADNTDGALGVLNNLTLIDYKDSDPTNTTAISSRIELRFEREGEDTSYEALLDLNFDSANDMIPISLFSPSLSRTWFIAGTIASPNIAEIAAGMGQDGTSAAYMVSDPGAINSPTTVGGPQLGNFYWIRNPGTAIKVTITYQSQYGALSDRVLNPPLWIWRKNTHPFLSGGITTASKGIRWPETPSGEWGTFEFICPATSGKFLTPRLEMRTLATDSVTDILIDNIKIEPYVENPELTAVINSNTFDVVYERSKNYEVDMNPATGNVTINIVDSLNTGEWAEMNLVTIQDATASRTVTWTNNGTSATYVVGSAQPTASANAKDLWRMVTADGGGNWVIVQVAADF